MFNKLKNLHYVCYISRCKTLIITTKNIVCREGKTLKYFLVIQRWEAAKQLPQTLKLRVEATIHILDTFNRSTLQGKEDTFMYNALESRSSVDQHKLNALLNDMQFKIPQSKMVQRQLNLMLNLFVTEFYKRNQVGRQILNFFSTLEVVLLLTWTSLHKSQA